MKFLTMILKAESAHPPLVKSAATAATAAAATAIVVVLLLVIHKTRSACSDVEEKTRDYRLSFSHQL